MPLLVSLASLHKGSVHVTGELPPEDVALETLDPCIEARSPVRFDVEVELMEQEVFVQGWAETMLDCQCVRCLTRFNQALRLDPWTCLLPLQGEGKVEIRDESVDLTPQLREDSLLALPQHPLCRPECPGLPRRPLDSGHPDGSSDDARRSPSAWSILDKLKLD